MYQQLQAGQLDAVFNDLPVSLDAAKNNPDLQVVEQIETGEEYTIAVAKTNPELKAALNEGLQSMFEDGTFADDLREVLPRAGPPELRAGGRRRRRCQHRRREREARQGGHTRPSARTSLTRRSRWRRAAS